MTGYEHCLWSFLLDFAGNPPPNTSPTAFFLEAPMRHPALRRSARHSSKRDARPDPAKMIPPEAAAVPADPASPGNPESSHDPAAQKIFMVARMHNPAALNPVQASCSDPRSRW